MNNGDELAALELERDRDRGMPGYSTDERLLRAELLIGANAQNTAANTAAIGSLTRLVHGRPSWAVATFIGVQSAIIGALGSATVALIISR